MSSKQAQQTGVSTVTGPQSMVLLKNMLRLSVSSICYMRSIFPPDCFSSKDYAGLKVHQLECAEKGDDGEVLVKHPEAFLLSQWLERGVFEALEKHFLKSVSFTILIKHPRTGEDQVLESYQFLIDYPDGQAPTLNGMATTRENLKKQAVTFIRCLVEFTNTLEDLPEERWLSMKLLYFDDRTPIEYEPEYFRSANADIFKLHGDPLKIKIGKLETPYHTLQLKFTGVDLDSLLVDENRALPKIQEKNNIIDVKSSFRSGNKILDDFESEIPAHHDNPAPHISSDVKAIQEKLQHLQTDDHLVDASKTTMNADIIHKIYDYIMSQGKAQVKDCANALRIDEGEVKAAFQTMVSDGILKKKGLGFTVIIRTPTDQRPSFDAAKGLQNNQDVVRRPQKPNRALEEESQSIQELRQEYSSLRANRLVQNPAENDTDSTCADFTPNAQRSLKKEVAVVTLPGTDMIPKRSVKRIQEPSPAKHHRVVDPMDTTAYSQDGSNLGMKCSIVSDPLHQDVTRRRIE